MAVVLLTGSGLMIKTFISLLSIDPGFGATNVLTMRVTASSGGYPDGEAVAGFYEELLRRVRDVPGVKGAGAARLLPLASQMGDSGFRPAWYQPEPNESTQADWQYATSGYIETMGIPLVEGRTFDERDVRDGQTVVMINEHLARRYWGEDSPLGSEVLAFGADTAVVASGAPPCGDTPSWRQPSLRPGRPHYPSEGPRGRCLRRGRWAGTAAHPPGAVCPPDLRRPRVWSRRLMRFVPGAASSARYRAPPMPPVAR